MESNTKDSFNKKFLNEHLILNRHKKESITKSKLKLIEKGLLKNFALDSNLVIYHKNFSFNPSSNVLNKNNQIHLDKLLKKHWMEINGVKTKEIFHNDVEKIIFSIINEYNDLYYPIINSKNYIVINRIIILHCLNHIKKSQDLIEKNNKEINSNSRDKGFYRPKVLILAPFKSDCSKFINELIELIPNETKNMIGNSNRFKEEYYKEDNVKLEKEYFKKKPNDFKERFGGNNIDNFKIGISFLKKSIKLYADFKQSDIIVASPLSLKLLLESPEENEMNDKNNKKLKVNEEYSESDDNTYSDSEDLGYSNYNKINSESKRTKNSDFLSSIEIVYLYKAETFLMQNWEHVAFVIRNINRMPVSAKNTNFFRVRKYALRDESKYYRQLIICSSLISPCLTSLFSSSLNISGQYKFRKYLNGEFFNLNFDNKDQNLPKQRFKRFKVNNIEDSFEKRIKFFDTQIFQKQIEINSTGNLIFVSHYFDFIALRNLFTKNNVSFDFCSEYSKIGDNARARTNFKKKKISFLLITERFYFFRRWKFQSIRKLFFYDLPIFPQFFNELIVQSEETVEILFCKYDSNKLERIVGTSKKKTLLNSKGNNFVLFHD